MKKTPVDWSAVERAMRRCVTNRGTEEDALLCQRAWRSDKKSYGELNQRVRGEEFEAEKQKWRGS